MPETPSDQPPDANSSEPAGSGSNRRGDDSNDRPHPIGDFAADTVDSIKEVVADPAAELLRRTDRRLRHLWSRSSLKAEIARDRAVRVILSIRRPLQSRNVVIGILALLAALLVVYLTADTLPRETALMAGIFVAAALLWATEALPLFATALLIIGLEIILLANPGNWPGLGFSEGPTPSYETFLAPIADPIIILFLGGFIIARAAVKEGVDRTLAKLVLRGFGTRPGNVMLGLMAITAVFSMWMSNTAATAMMITLVTPMIAGIDKADPLRVGLVLSVPFAANIGGMGTPISSPPNAVAVGFLNSAGYPVSFLEWMVVAVPLATGLLLLSWVVLRWMYPPERSSVTMNADASSLDARSIFVLTVMVVTIVLWCTDRWHGLPTAVVALLPVVAFTATGLLTQADFDSLEWNILILIAGGIALGTGMQSTGLDEVIVGFVPAGGPFVILALAVTTVLVSTLMSNTAAANLLVPIGVALAMGAASTLDPIHVAISIALAASVSMALPVSTPPNAIAYASGVCNTNDFVRAGSLIGLVALVLIVTLGGPIIAFWIPM